MRHEFVGAVLVERADLRVGHRWRHSPHRTPRRRAGRHPCRFRVRDIARDHPAMRARTLHPSEIEAGVFGKTACQRGRENTVAALAARRLGGAPLTPAGFVGGRDCAAGAAAFGGAACGFGVSGRFCRRRRLRRATRRSLHVLALARQHRDHGVDCDILRAFRHHDLGQRAFVDRLVFHRRLVGLDLGDDVARLDLVALFLEPARQVALFHGGRQRGHEDVGGHDARLPVRHGLRRLDHLGDRRQRQLLEIGGVRHRHFLAGDARDRRIKIIEGLLHQPRGDLGADAGLRPAFFDGHAAAGLLHRGDDGVGVHRA